MGAIEVRFRFPVGAEALLLDKAVASPWPDPEEELLASSSPAKSRCLFVSRVSRRDAGVDNPTKPSPVPGVVAST